MAVSPAILLWAQVEPQHALAWLQAGRSQRGQLVGCRVKCNCLLASLLASLVASSTGSGADIRRDRLIGTAGHSAVASLPAD